MYKVFPPAPQTSYPNLILIISMRYHTLRLSRIWNRSKSPGGIRKHRTLRVLRSISLLGHARQPLALEITAWAFFESSQRSKSLPQHCSSSSPLDITAQACSAVMGRSKARLGYASKPFGTRERCSSKLLVRKQFRFSYPFRNRSATDYALPRAVLCATSQALQGAICESGISEIGG